MRPVIVASDVIDTFLTTLVLKSPVFSGGDSGFKLTTFGSRQNMYMRLRLLGHLLFLKSNKFLDESLLILFHINIYSYIFFWMLFIN